MHTQTGTRFTLSSPPGWPSGKDVHLQGGRPGSDPCFYHGSFTRSSHTSDLNIGTPVAALPGAWCYRVQINPSVSLS